MAITRSRTSQATRDGTRGVVIEGLDAVVSEFSRKADRIPKDAGKTVVEYAEKAAQRMRDRVPVDEGDTLDSISADQRPTLTPGGVYADAGPSWFVARFIEHGTVKMPPRPFVGPAAAETLPEFEKALRGLAR